MFTLKYLFTSATAFIFLFGSVDADLLAQNCSKPAKSSAVDSDSAIRLKPDERDAKKENRHQEYDDQKIAEVVDEKVTITGEGEDFVDEEILVATKRTVRKIAIPEHAIKEASRARKAAAVLEDSSNMWGKGIPDALLRKAKAVAVFPNVVKGALGFGGRWGKGLISRRDECGNWIAPSFVNITGGSFGFQAGVQATDLILVFTDKDAVDALLKGKLTLGGGASATAGPLGRDAEIGTDVLLQSAIYSYSSSKGLFLGVSLDGAAITIDDSANRNAYSQHIHGEEILKERQVQMNSVVEPFIVALNAATGVGEENHAADAGGAEVGVDE